MWNNYLKPGDLMWLDEGRAVYCWPELDKDGYGEGNPVRISFGDIAMFLAPAHGRKGQEWDKVLYGEQKHVDVAQLRLRTLKFHVGMLVRILVAADQEPSIRKLAKLNAIGLIVEHPISQNMTTFTVLINERVYYHVHVLDMEPL